MKIFDIVVPEPLAGAFRACRPHLVGIAVFSALVNVLFLAPSIYMLQVYDRVVPTSGLMTLFYITLVVALALITLALLDAVRARLLVRVSLRLDRLVSGPLLEKLMARTAPGAPVQGMREFDTLRNAISGPAALGFLDAPWTPLYVAISFMLHPALGLLTVVGGAILVTLAIFNERSTKTKAQDAAKAINAAYAAQEAAAMSTDVVRAMGMRGALRERQLSDRRNGLALAAQAQFTGGQFAAATKFMRLFLQSAALGLGAWLAVERQISAGAIIAASILMSRALQPVEQVVGAWGTVVQARTALRVLSDLFAASPEPETPRTQLPSPSGRLVLDKVVVRAPGAPDQLLLKGVSLTVDPGQTLGVVGPSGAGKTTLARLAAGASVPDMGVVRLGRQHGGLGPRSAGPPCRLSAAGQRPDRRQHPGQHLPVRPLARRRVGRGRRGGRGRRHGGRRARHDPEAPEGLRHHPVPWRAGPVRRPGAANWPGPGALR